MSAWGDGTDRVAVVICGVAGAVGGGWDKQIEGRVVGRGCRVSRHGRLVGRVGEIVRSGGGGVWVEEKIVLVVWLITVFPWRIAEGAGAGGVA